MFVVYNIHVRVHVSTCARVLLFSILVLHLSSLSEFLIPVLDDFHSVLVLLINVRDLSFDVPKEKEGEMRRVKRGEWMGGAVEEEVVEGEKREGTMEGRVKA